MSFEIGATVGKYRIIEQMGQGGMATVFKAYHAELDRYVALKVLHPAFLEDPNFLARFQREARLVAKLDHPNIVPIYDYAEHEKRPYLVMKFIEGETLKARLAQGKVTPAEIRIIVEAVGEALAYAHKQGILHRDIKPSNVLLAKDGQIYLADFGLARIAQSGESTLTTDMILGTPQYISPEQALGRKDLNEGTDIYSFGVMLYEMTVGRVPFSADTPFSIIHDHIYSPLPMPHDLNPAISDEVERILLKALAKDRDDRYRDIKSLVSAFIAAWSTADATLLLPEEAPGAIEEGGEELTLPPAPSVEEKSTSATKIQPVSSTPAEASAGKKKKSRWMWAALGVILLFSCLIVLNAIRVARLFQNLPAQQTIAAANTAISEQVISPLEQALREAEANPEDSSAQLRLALAYQQAGQNEPAQETLNQVLRLAAGNENLMWDSARKAADQEAWLCAARLAVAGADLHLQAGTELPAFLRTLLHESVYKAAKDKLAGAYLLTEPLSRLDEPLYSIAEARYTFLYAKPERGQEMLDSLMEIKPGFTEGILLQADFSARTGDEERARRSLELLRSDPKVEDWMLREAETIEGSLP